MKIQINSVIDCNVYYDVDLENPRKEGDDFFVKINYLVKNDKYLKNRKVLVENKDVITYIENDRVLIKDNEDNRLLDISDYDEIIDYVYFGSGTKVNNDEKLFHYTSLYKKYEEEKYKKELSIKDRITFCKFKVILDNFDVLSKYVEEKDDILGEDLPIKNKFFLDNGIICINMEGREYVKELEDLIKNGIKEIFNEDWEVKCVNLG